MKNLFNSIKLFAIFYTAHPFSNSVAVKRKRKKTKRKLFKKKKKKFHKFVCAYTISLYEILISVCEFCLCDTHNSLSSHTVQSGSAVTSLALSVGLKAQRCCSSNKVVTLDNMKGYCCSGHFNTFT